MKHLIFAIMIIFSVGLASGCAGDKAKELMDTAMLEEKQHNKEHAGKLYQEIIQKYPNSQYAKDARKRLEAMKN